MYIFYYYRHESVTHDWVLRLDYSLQTILLSDKSIVQFVQYD